LASPKAPNCTTFLNIAKYDEIMAKIKFTGTAKATTNAAVNYVI